LLKFVLPSQAIKNLASLYESPEDLDVYVAGILEKKVGKAEVGPTFLCIMVDQFRRWKEGDRFFVDLKGYAFSFTPGKLYLIVFHLSTSAERRDALAT